MTDQRSAVRRSATPALCADPGLVGLWGVHRLDLVPGLDSLPVGLTPMRRHEIGDEVHIAAVLDSQGTLFGLVQGYGVLDQVPVGNRPAREQLLLAPAVQQIPRAGGPLETRL